VITLRRDVGATNVRVCLHKVSSSNIAAGFWQRDYAAVNQNCQNLSNHSWHIGGPVNDATSSVLVSVGGIPANKRFRVRFYDWTNCSSANGYFDYTTTIGGGFFSWALDS
jgi:hypothetical protein